jgi:hypothetical protein
MKRSPGFDSLFFHTDSYHTTFPNDPLTHKLLVYIVFVLETVQTILVAYDRYVALVLGFGDALAQEAVGTGWFSIPLLSGLCRCTFSGDSRMFNRVTSRWHCASILCPSDLQVLEIKDTVHCDSDGGSQILTLENHMADQAIHICLAIGRADMCRSGRKCTS